MTDKLQCDLVMRGGITSGIVYPRAIAKLAETYDFRSIGGTSAGAIAAAGTAAAAYGAKHGKNHFAKRFKGLPEEFGEELDGKTVLERLFQPQPGTRHLFRLLMASLGRGAKPWKWAKVAALLCASYWFFASIGAAIVLAPLLLVSLVIGISGWQLFFLILAGCVPALVLALLGAAYGASRNLRRLKDNNYGLCSGSSNGKRDEADVLPLTDWLHEFFQSIANRAGGTNPVTFGDLWGNGGDPQKEREIELVLMTTNVTRGVSHRFPFLEGSWGQLFFNKKEFEALFPRNVVEWMCKKQAPVRRPDSIEVPEGYYPLPAPADLPILLGARMSLSFPLLLAAVPLWAANFEADKTDDGKFPLECCWFSDGGLTSNFPIHFFDSPLPSRPTFAINLISYEVDASETEETDNRISRLSGVKDERSEAWNMVWMPSQNSTGIGSSARFNKFDSVFGFFGAVFDTARNWADTELMAMPGYRERIVHVKLAEDEGGLNLSMAGDQITAIGERGERAGELLAARFAPTPTGKDRLTDPQSEDEVRLTWDNHRWIRYRATMAAFEELVRRFRATWQDAAKQKPWRAYADLLNRGGGEMPKSYPLERPEQQEFASDATQAFVDFVSDWADDRTFDRGQDSDEGRSPRPKPVLRMMPPGSNDPRTERAGS
jgi:predicted acylesterase/phospholipase RssA